MCLRLAPLYTYHLLLKFGSRAFASINVIYFHAMFCQKQGVVDGVSNSRGCRVGLRSVNCDLPPPISFVAYWESVGGRLDAQRLFCRPIYGSFVELCDLVGTGRDIAVKAWINQWSHWGCWAAAELESSAFERDTCYICVARLRKPSMIVK